MASKELKSKREREKEKKIFTRLVIRKDLEYYFISCMLSESRPLSPSLSAGTEITHFLFFLLFYFILFYFILKERNARSSY